MGCMCPGPGLRPGERHGLDKHGPQRSGASLALKAVQIPKLSPGSQWEENGDGPGLTSGYEAKRGPWLLRASPLPTGYPRKVPKSHALCLTEKLRAEEGKLL